MTKSMKIILTILLLAALAMPISAAYDNGRSHDNGWSHDDSLKESDVDHIPGYEIIAYTISLNANPDKIPADGNSTSTITAQLKDRKNKDVKVKDVIINFQTKKGTLSANSAVTNNNGRATVTLTSSTKPETANIKASSDSVLNPDETKVEFKAVKIYGISLTAVPDNISADGKSTSTITAQLKDNNGNDVSVKNVKINFETTKGTLKGRSAFTDNHGRASVTLKSSTKIETAVIKATSEDVLNYGTVQVNFTKVVSRHHWNEADLSGFGFILT